ncbi:MAG: alginate export family protein [Acidobacteria bacterium]|nr:alginate export family protein [Acidobacteriota bacterium]
MRRPFLVGVLCLFIVGGVGPLLPAQNPPALAPPRPRYETLRYDEDWSYLRDISRRSDFWDPVKYIRLNPDDSWYVSLGGETRFRYEAYHNSNFGSDPSKYNGYLLQRHLFHTDFHLGEHARFYGQILSALENGRGGGPRSIDEDRLDLQQSFLELKFSFATKSDFFIRAGRQEIDLGSSRLVSTREPQNVRQRFDGLRLEITTGNHAWRIGALATRPVIPKSDLFDDVPDHTVTFTGAYVIMPNPAIPGGRMSFYWAGFGRKLSRYDQGTGQEFRNTLGTRYFGIWKNFDYNYEFIYQIGSFRQGRIRAWTIATDSGYTFQTVRFYPRFGLGADISSGDRDPANPDLQTFNALFANNAYSAKVGLVGPANSINLNPSVRFRIGEHVIIVSDWAFFWRESLRDGTYFTSGTLQRTGQNNLQRFVGSQPSLQFVYRFSSHLDLTAIYTHVFPGPFIRQSPPAKPLDYVTNYLTYRF